MTEQAVKDAKAKRDAAQADLDKAVKDTKDEVEKSTAAVKDAEATKPVAPMKVDPPKAEPAKPAEAAKGPALSPPKQPNPPVVVAHEASTSARDGVLVILAVAACAAAAVAHFVFHAF